MDLKQKTSSSFNSIYSAVIEFFKTITIKKTFSKIIGSVFFCCLVTIPAYLLILAGVSLFFTSILQACFVLCIYINKVYKIQKIYKPSFNQWLFIVTTFVLGYVLIITPFWFLISSIKLEPYFLDFSLAIFTGMALNLTDMDLMNPYDGSSGSGGPN